MSANAETLIRSLGLSASCRSQGKARAARWWGGATPRRAASAGGAEPSGARSRAVAPHVLAAGVPALLDEPVAEAFRRRPGPDRLQLVAAAPVGHEPLVVTGHQPEVVP